MSPRTEHWSGHHPGFRGGQRTRSGPICTSLCSRVPRRALFSSGLCPPLPCAMAHWAGRGLGGPDHEDYSSILTLRTQPESSLHSPPTGTFMIPFQLSPVETWKSVRKAMPKFSKVACRLMPSHGFSSLQTEGEGGVCPLARPPLRAPSPPPRGAVCGQCQAHRPGH